MWERPEESQYERVWGEMNTFKLRINRERTIYSNGTTFVLFDLELELKLKQKIILYIFFWCYGLNGFPQILC